MRQKFVYNYWNERGTLFIHIASLPLLSKQCESCQYLSVSPIHFYKFKGCGTQALSAFNTFLIHSYCAHNITILSLIIVFKVINHSTMIHNHVINTQTMPGNFNI